MEQFRFIVIVTGTMDSLRSLSCLTFSILPQKLRIILEDNEVICSQKREVPLMEFMGTCGAALPSVLVLGLEALEVAAQYFLCCCSFSHAMGT